MSFSGKILCEKIQGLRPEISDSITPDLLNKICDDTSLQPFLKWFCENVTHANVLSNEEMRLADKLQREGKWMEGPELDQALQDATKNCPDLLKSVYFDPLDVNDLISECKMLKDLEEEDNSYILTINNGIQNLQKIENKLDEDEEEQKALLEREHVEADKAYYDCSMILNTFNKSNHIFFNDLDLLVNVYADAAENKGPPVLWTQMPLVLFVKQMELYNHYVSVHVRRQFGNVKEDPEADSDYASFINDSKERTMDKTMQELMSCKTKLTNSKIEGIIANAQKEACIAMLEYARDIYNNGNLKIPHHSELQLEISLLTKKRDFLEENITLLRERQLVDIVQQFTDLETIKILQEDAQIRLERKTARLKKLKNLCSITRQNGHAHSDLLCMLMEMQRQCLQNVSEFVADGRHYLETEYLLSSSRCEIMRHHQNEYTTLLENPSQPFNLFDQLFISMMCNNDISLQFNSALDKYDTVVVQIKEKKRKLETHIKCRINKLHIMEDKLNSNYTEELYTGATCKLRPVPYEISTCYEKVLHTFDKLQSDLKNMRNTLKDQAVTNTSLKREKSILWQRFIANPTSLREIYQEIKQRANSSHFGSSTS